jgi:conjugative transfer signal peptidase TraF
MILAIFGGVGLIAAATIDHRPSLIWNASASAPIGLYAVRSTGTTAVDQLVLYAPAPALAEFMAARRYLPTGVPLVKTIVAITPSRVCRDGSRVTVDGVPVALALPADRIGRPLPTWSGCRRMRTDEVFLLSPGVPDALDSRYFGPVPRSRIMARITPIWTRKASR